MMLTNVQFNSRPYWHVDAKWVTAILLLFLLSATFLTFILVQVTGEEQGIEILTVVLASSFSRDGLDQEADIQIIHEKIAASPDGSWQPLPGLNISVREEDIAGLSPREMRLWFFRHLAEPIYHDGQAGLAKLATSPEMAKNMQDSLGLLGFISADMHARLSRVLTVLGLISFALLALLVYFSYRFGRLGSPGCVLFLSAVPGVAMFSMLRGWLERAGQNPSAQTEVTDLTVYTQMAEKLAVDVLPAIVQKGLQTYLILTVIGLGLMLGAMLGGLIYRWRQRWR